MSSEEVVEQSFSRKWHWNKLLNDLVAQAEDTLVKNLVLHQLEQNQCSRPWVIVQLVVQEQDQYSQLTQCYVYFH